MGGTSLDATIGSGRPSATRPPKAERSAPPRPHRLTSRSLAEWLAIGTPAVLGIWAILTVLVPAFRFAYFWPRARTSIETAGILVSAMAAALAYLRYSFTAGRSALLIAVAFVVIAANQLVSGTLIDPLRQLSRAKMLYFFTAGRFVTGV